MRYSILMPHSAESARKELSAVTEIHKQVTIKPAASPLGQPVFMVTSILTTVASIDDFIAKAAESLDSEIEQVQTPDSVAASISSELLATVDLIQAHHLSQRCVTSRPSQQAEHVTWIHAYRCEVRNS